MAELFSMMGFSCDHCEVSMGARIKQRGISVDWFLLEYRFCMYGQSLER